MAASRGRGGVTGDVSTGLVGETMPAPAGVEFALPRV